MIRNVKLSDIEKRLKPHYSPEVNKILALPKFIKTEILLMLMVRIAPDDDATKAYLLLTRLDIIGKKSFSDVNLIFYTASHLLKELRSKKIWEDYLDAYKTIHTSLRLFTITDGNKISIKKSDNLPYSDRINDYDKVLMNLPERKKEKVSFAAELELYKFYNKKLIETIRFPSNIKLDSQPIIKNKKGEQFKSV